MGRQSRSSSDSIDSAIRLIIGAPESGSTSPASKIGVAPKSIPVSLQRFADSEAKAARMSGGASAGPRINEEFSSHGMPIMATCIFVMTSARFRYARRRSGAQVVYYMQNSQLSVHPFPTSDSYCQHEQHYIRQHQ